MPSNRIRELRKRKNMSADELAALVQLSREQVTRIENGTRGLSMPRAEAFAMALGSSVEEVLGLNGSLPSAHQAPGLSDEAVRYEAGPADIIEASVKRRPNLSAYQIKESLLDQIDVHDGDVLIVDVSAAAVEAVLERAQRSTEPIVVVARIYGNDPLDGATVVRQFIPPNLLISNSRRRNVLPLNLDVDEVHIRGVAVGKHRVMGGG